MSAVASHNNVENEVIEAIRKGALLENKTISADSTLESLGIDSLDMTNISFEIEDRLGFVLNPEDLGDTKTVSDLTALIHSRQAASGSNL